MAPAQSERAGRPGRSAPATRSGKVKKTALAEYDSPRQGGLIAVRLMTDENGFEGGTLFTQRLCAFGFVPDIRLFQLGVYFFQTLCLWSVAAV